jgi:Ca2+-transporting ATPase
MSVPSGPDPLTGLSDEEAARRLEVVGPNEIATGGGRSIWQIARETMREPMFLLLMGAALLYLVVGDLGEGLFLVLGAAAAIGLVIAQEARSERALGALRELAQPRARVIRGGAERHIAARDLVPDDILLIGEGERLPADGVLVSGDVLSVDESALTGESAPVSKQPSVDAPDADPVPGAETGPYVFAGTMVVRGQGVVRLTRTGPASALGQIGASLAEIVQAPTPLQKTAARLVGLLGIVALGFCGVIVVAYGLVRDDWMGGALAGITLAISLIPEEFPMVLAVFMALGAWRLATHQVLARRGAVIETLGGASVLCVDKTGTLTENRMRVARVWTPAADTPIADGTPADGPAAEVLRVAALASAVRPVDPMDKAVRTLGGERAALGVASPEPERAWPLIPGRLAVVQLWPLSDGGRIAAAKGAPEAIFRLCRLDEGEIERLQGVIHAYAEAGLRVLGVAQAQVQAWTADDPADVRFDFAGLLGFLDPLRPDVPAALAEAKGAGIKVVMITGDHPSTALAIARSAGIDTEAGVLLGQDVEDLPFEALCQKLQTVRVFARIVPAQKLRVVEALKADGEVVAMTGDGVNDAPALEAAHIGVAMGRRGSDVAREAADLVLLDDSFASIVGGVRLGRRIFANLRRALTYITAIHVPIAGLALAPVLLGLPPLLLPMHVVLLELVIDPTCSLVFEAEPSEAGAMKRKPRRPDEPLFGPAQIGLALLQGAGVLAAVLAVYLWALPQMVEAQARGAAFGALVLANLVLALTDSAASGRIFVPQHRTYWTIAGAVAAAMTLVVAVPFLADMFKVALPGWQAIGVAVAAAMVSGGWPVLLRLGRPAR